MFFTYEKVVFAYGTEKDEHKHEDGEKHEVHEDRKSKIEKKHDDHDHEHEKESSEKHNDHEEGEGDEHGHEENNQVGPGKGIVSASEEDGIQISPEAEKNFEIKKIKVPIQAQFEIPKAAVVTAGTEVNLYRFREGRYKRVDFDFVSKADKKVVVKSKELKSGDEIVVQGMGLLRIAEIAAFGGAPEGHSH
jgi:hypothetical protein